MGFKIRLVNSIPIPLQCEYFVPGGGEGLVLGVRLQAVVAELQHAEGVALASDVGRSQSLGSEDLRNQVPNVTNILEGFRDALHRKKGSRIIIG